MYVPSVNFKHVCFAFCRIARVPVGINNPSLVCCLLPFHSLLLLFKGHVVCQNFTLTWPC